MEYFTSAERTILETLSLDSRASIALLSKNAKCSRATAIKSLKRLQDKLDIRYTLEIDESKLAGSERHLIVIKFLNKPTEKFLMDFFKNDKYAQEVYMLEGEFDLFIYARAGDPASYIKWETYIASELSEYRPELKPSEFVVAHFGFWPLGDGFVEEISRHNKIDKKDREMLVLLNQNSRMGIPELAKKVGMGNGTARYRLFRLQRSGIVKRFTIAIQNPPQKYRIMHFSNYRFNKNINERMLEIRKFYLNADSAEPPVIGTFQIVAPISGSFRSFALSAFYREEDVLEAIPKMHKKVFKKDNIEIRYAKITSVVKGLLPFRNLEIKGNYMPIQWTRE